MTMTLDDFLKQTNEAASAQFPDVGFSIIAVESDDVAKGERHHRQFEHVGRRVHGDAGHPLSRTLLSSSARASSPTMTMRTSMNCRRRLG
jgi:hypothetical protein